MNKRESEIVAQVSAIVAEQFDVTSKEIESARAKQVPVILARRDGQQKALLLLGQLTRGEA